MPGMLLLMGDISAGFPSPAEGSEEQRLDVQEFLVQHPAATFFYKVDGDELKDEHIRGGSFLVVDRSLINRKTQGRLVVVEHHGVTWVCRHRNGQPIEGIIIGVVTGNFVKY